MAKRARASSIARPNQAGSSAQRSRFGLTGLAFAFLLVLLGSVISRSSKNDQVNSASDATTNQPSEPLAELGDDIAAEAVDEARDVFDNVEGVVLDQWREVHGEGERVAPVHAVAFKKGGVGPATTLTGDVVPLAPRAPPVEATVRAGREPMSERA